MRRAPLPLSGKPNLVTGEDTHLGSFLSILKFQEAAPPSRWIYQRQEACIPRTAEHSDRSWHTWRGEQFRRVLMAVPTVVEQ